MVHFRLKVDNPFMEDTDPDIRGQIMRDIEWADGRLSEHGQTISSFVYTDYRNQPAQKYLLMITKTGAGGLDVTNAVVIP